MADSTPSVLSTPQITNDVVPSIKVETSAIVNQAPSVVSPSIISAAVTSTSTTPVLISQAPTLPSSKVSCFLLVTRSCLLCMFDVSDLLISLVK